MKHATGVKIFSCTMGASLVLGGIGAITPALAQQWGADAPACANGAITRNAVDYQDRKSTRLNSSHWS